MTTTERLRALLGDRYDAVIEQALDAVDTPDHGYQVMRGNVDERDVSTALAAVLPDLLAEAWDAGYEAAAGDFHDDEFGLPGDRTPNPYRTEETR